MKRLMLFSVLLLFAHASGLYGMSREEKIDDAHSIINLFTQQYGPLKWKIEHLGIDFQEIADRFLKAAETAETDKDFYKAAALFVGSFKDAHVSYTIPSSLVAMLPFSTEYFPDGVVVTYVFKEKRDDPSFGLKEGDEVVAIDGVPVEDVIDYADSVS